MCGNPIKMIKNMFSPPKPKTPTINVMGNEPQTLAQIQQDREALNTERASFRESQKQFNKDQQRWLQEAKQQQAQPVILPQVEKKQAAPITASETENSINSRRRGRNSLRIPLSSSNAGGGGTGVNIPRG